MKLNMNRNTNTITTMKLNIWNLDDIDSDAYNNTYDGWKIVQFTRGDTGYKYVVFPNASDFPFIGNSFVHSIMGNTYSGDIKYIRTGILTDSFILYFLFKNKK